MGNCNLQKTAAIVSAYLAKVRVDGSNPFARSKSLSKINGLEPLALFKFPKKVIYGS